MVLSGTVIPEANSEFRRYVEEQSGQNISKCYQCGKCTAGCPLAYAMDITPRQVMRAIQLGLKDEVLSSSAIWLCVSCQTCSARCPLEIDIAKVMESLRLLAVKENIKPAEKDINLFHRIFFGLIEHRGRVHELELGLRYNLSTRHPFANSSLGVKMIAKGKMTSIRPSRVKGASEVERLFRRVREIEARTPPQEEER